MPQNTHSAELSSPAWRTPGPLARPPTKVSATLIRVTKCAEAFQLESAPLLQDVSHPDGEESPHHNHSITERVSSVVQEPLSPLTKILLVLVLLLLLLSSIFIGLFAGAQHKLSAGKGDRDEKIPSTHTETYTQTSTGTLTFTTTKTSIGISTTTAVSTSTSVSTSTATLTSTVVIPAPVPTHVPEEVGGCADFSNQIFTLTYHYRNLVSLLNASSSQQRFCLLLTCRKILVRTSMTSPVRYPIILRVYDVLSCSTSIRMCRWWLAQTTPHSV